MLVTPASGIYRTSHDHSGLRCHECRQPLFTFSRYPKPPEHRCTNRRCEQCAIPRAGEKTPTFGDLWLC